LKPLSNKVLGRLLINFYLETAHSSGQACEQKTRTIITGCVMKMFVQTKIPNRIPIDQRPESVTTREEFGHWETDRLISRKSSAALNSTCERKTKLLFLTKMPKKTAEETSVAIINRL
jgi:IS30 family transposase